MIKILVCHPWLQAPHIEQIKRVSDAVSVGFAYSAADLPRTILDSPLAKEALSEGDFAREAADAEILFGGGAPMTLRSLAPRLKWIHSLGAGVDGFAGRGLGGTDIVMTAALGTASTPISEYCIMLMLAHCKSLRQRIDWQREHLWRQVINAELKGATLGIIGPGGIGLALAAKARVFGMRVLAVRRNFTELLPHIDRMYSPAQLNEMLGQCDFVVSTVGLAEDTRRMLGEAQFRAMKQGAFFINTGRGPVVDQDALIRALQTGHLAGAGLDVFDPEPLPKDSPLWDMTSVYISAHNSNGTDKQPQRATDIFCDNLRRYLNNQPLRHKVAIEKGF